MPGPDLHQDITAFLFALSTNKLNDCQNETIRYNIPVLSLVAVFLH